MVDKIRGDWYWVAAYHLLHHHHYCHHRQHIRLDYGGTKWVSGYTTPSPLLIQLILTLAGSDSTLNCAGSTSTTVSPIYENKTVFLFLFISRVGPRVQGQTVLIQIPLCCCVTNNPIQNSLSFSLSRPVSRNLYTPGEGRLVWTYLHAQ